MAVAVGLTLGGLVAIGRCVAAGLDLVAHEDAEQVVGGAGVVHGDLQERAVGRDHGRVAQLLGVHFPQALETRDLHALLAAAADGRQQAAEIVQPDGALAAAEQIARLLHAGPLLRNQAVDLETHLPQLGQLAVDRTHLVELDDVQAAAGMAVAVG